MVATRESTDIVDKVVILHTTSGDIKLFFHPEVAPNHVRNFLYLVGQGFYSGVDFHRIVEDFMIQGGQPRPDWKEPVPPMKAEFNDLPHTTGTLAAARTSDPNSATSQFYLVLTRAHARHLDKQYTVFGQAFEGLDVIKKIADNWVSKVSNLPDRQADRTTSDDKILSAEVVDRAPYADAIAAYQQEAKV